MASAHRKLGQCIRSVPGGERVIEAACSLLSPPDYVALQHMQAVTAALPLMVSVETTMLCNARCMFCAYPKVERPKSAMTLDLWRKFCMQFVTVGGGLLGFPPLISDPLVDPLLIERVRYAGTYHFAISLHVFTNGLRLITIPENDPSTSWARSATSTSASAASNGTTIA